MADGLFTSLVGLGLSAYDKLNKREELPLNKQVFLETVLDKSKEPITESRLTPELQAALKDLIYNTYNVPEFKGMIGQYQNYLEQKLDQSEKAKKEGKKGSVLYKQFEDAYKQDLEAIKQFRSGVLTQRFIDMTSGSPGGVSAQAMKEAGLSAAAVKKPASITYQDYPSGRESSSGGQNIHSKARNVFKEHTPTEQLATLLGQFGYSVDPTTGNLVVKDVYDFNPTRGVLSGSPVKPSAENVVATGAEGGGSGIYGILREYAGRAIPPGQGREVRINLNQTGFEPTIK